MFMVGRFLMKHNRYFWALSLCIALLLTGSDASVIKKYRGISDTGSPCELELKVSDGLLTEVRFRAPKVSTRVSNVWLKAHFLPWEKEMSLYPWEWELWEYWFDEEILPDQMVQGIDIMKCAQPDVYDYNTKEIEFDGTCFIKYYTVFEVKGSPSRPADGFDIFFRPKSTQPLAVTYFRESHSQNLYIDKPEPLYCIFKEQ